MPTQPAIYVGDLNVFSYRIKVYKVYGLSEGNENLHGAYERNTIYLNASDGPSDQNRALIHELIHFISEKLDLKLSEAKVRALELGLYEAGVRAEVPSV